MREKPNPDDVILWPCGTWCYRYESHQMTHKSDDYEVIAEGSDKWYDITEDDAR